MLSVEIAKALLEIGSVEFRLDNPITFKSGVVSPVYTDNRKLPYFPAAWKQVLYGFKELLRLESIPVDVFAGIESGGIPHSAALGFLTETPSVFIRKKPKDHGTKKMVEGGVVEGKRVVLVEDLVTTGGSLMTGVQAVRDEGGIVEDCLAIVSYGFSGATDVFAENGVRLHVLTTFPVIFDEAFKSGLCDEKTKSKVEQWFANPFSWTAPAEQAVP